MPNTKHGGEVVEKEVEKPSENVVSFEREKDLESEHSKENTETRPSSPPRVYKPPLPFPQRYAKAKFDAKFGKFFNMLKQLNVNVPFLDALSQMPLYAKFLKEILSKKRKIDEIEEVALTEECSSVVLNKLTPKLKDPGSFSIPCGLGSLTVDRALCDVGSSVSLMPYSLYERLNLGELRPTTMSLQMADRSIKYPKGILEDFPLKVGDCYVPIDFVILDMPEDSRTQIILGRPFLATVGCVIDVQCGKMKFRIGEHELEFDLFRDVLPRGVSPCFGVDVLVRRIRMLMV